MRIIFFGCWSCGWGDNIFIYEEYGCLNLSSLAYLVLASGTHASCGLHSTTLKCHSLEKANLKLDHVRGLQLWNGPSPWVVNYQPVQGSQTCFKSLARLACPSSGLKQFVETYWPYLGLLHLTVCGSSRQLLHAALQWQPVPHSKVSAATYLPWTTSPKPQWSQSPCGTGWLLGNSIWRSKLSTPMEYCCGWVSVCGFVFWCC